MINQNKNEIWQFYLNLRGIKPRTRDPPPRRAIVKTFVLTTSILNWTVCLFFDHKKSFYRFVYIRTKLNDFLNFQSRNNHSTHLKTHTFINSVLHLLRIDHQLFHQFQFFVLIFWQILFGQQSKLQKETVTLAATQTFQTHTHTNSGE